MSDQTVEGAPRKKTKKFLGLTWGTWVAGALLIPVCVMTFNLYRSWSALRAKLGDAGEHAHRDGQAQRRAGQGVTTTCRTRQFQICNKTRTP